MPWRGFQRFMESFLDRATVHWSHEPVWDMPSVRSPAFSPICPTKLSKKRTNSQLFPLPVGEGQGEGNQVEVRESDSDQSGNRCDAPVLRTPPEVFQDDNGSFDAALGTWPL